jgi:DNA-binding response OmpR family regulator
MAQIETLLIIDPTAQERESLIWMLDNAGHHVTAYDNLPDGITRIRPEDFNLILLTTGTPGINAAETIKHFKAGERWPKPLMVILGEPEPKILNELMDLGADDYLRFPISVPALDAKTNNWIERKQLYELHRAYQEQIRTEKSRADDLLQVVIPLGVALSAEKDFNRLLETILLQAKKLCNADGGTLYLKTEDNHLRFVIVRNDSLKIEVGGVAGDPSDRFPLLPLYRADGSPNENNVATYAALTGKTVNIIDAYEERGYDFSGTKAFDQESGYRSMSFLTTPLKDLDDVIGVLQLINAKDPDTGKTVPFDERIHPIVESLALLATVALKAYIREEKLSKQIERLKIEIDVAKRQRQVDEITDTEYFQQLQKRAKAFKNK